MFDPQDVIDISVSLGKDTPTYPGLDPFLHEWVFSWEKGDSKCVSRMSMSCHVGTHVDAPLHFVPGGAAMGRIGWDRLCGKASVVELPGSTKRAIAESEIRRIATGKAIILLKTSNSRLWRLGAFSHAYRYLDETAARFLASSGVKTLGFDYVSIDPHGGPKTAHTILLEAGIAVIEGLDLGAVQPGDYFFLCLPLALPRSEAAPARAILVRCDDREGFLT